MRRNILAVIFTICIHFCVFAQNSDPIDLVLVLNNSTDMSPSYENVNNYITGNFLTEFLRIGDTFHLISFSSSPKLEIARRISGIGDIETIIGRMLLQYPVESGSNLSSTLTYTEQYVSTLPDRPKKIVVVSTAGTDANNLVNTSKQKLRPNTTLDFVQVTPGQPLANLPSSGRPQGNSFSTTTTPTATTPSTTTPSTTTPSTATTSTTTPSATTPSTATTSTTTPSTGTTATTTTSTTTPTPTTTPSTTTTATTTPSTTTPSTTTPSTATPSTTPSTTTPTTTTTSTTTPSTTTPSTATTTTSTTTTPSATETSSAEPASTGIVSQTTSETPAVTTTPATTQPEQKTTQSTSTQQKTGSSSKLPLIIGLVLLLLLLLGLLIYFLSRKSSSSPKRVVASSKKDDEEKPKTNKPANYAAVQPKQRTTPYADRRPVKQTENPLVINPTGPLLLNMFVEDQNTNIGKRNIHSLKSGYSLSVGGGNSDFLIFLVEVPANIGELRRNASQLTFIPRKHKYFPDLGSNELRDCLNKTIRIISDRNYEVHFRFEMYEDPLDALNRVLNQIKVPG